MTVVVYRDGVLATDSQSECNGWVDPCKATKLWRGDDGRLFAITGDQARATVAVQQLMKGEEIDLKDARVIEVQPGPPIRLIIHEEGGSFEQDPSAFTAWGTGAPPALGALHAGADAIEAVRIACLVDTNSGGEVVSYELSQRVEEAA